MELVVGIGALGASLGLGLGLARIALAGVFAAAFRPGAALNQPGGGSAVSRPSASRRRTPLSSSTSRTT